MPAGSPIVTATTGEGMDSILHGWGRPRSHSIRQRARYRNATLSNGYGAGAVPRSVESSRDRSTDGGRRAWRWLNAAAWPSATSPGLLHLAKLEGDAVFCYNREDEATGPMLLTMTESCYSAFARRLMNIRLRTTCECDACRLIPRLNLKFAIHFGQYVAHDVAGSRELMGRDVIVVHRLLKNSVKEKTGLRGYALYTQAVMQRFGLDPASLGAAAHTETYDDVGEIAGYVFDLEARWQEEQQRRAVYIAPGEGVTLVDAEMAAPPALVWDYLTSPAKRPLWQLDTRRVDQHNPRGLPGVGTTNHCVHGEYAVDEEILDWKPFQYFTERATTP